MTVTLHRPKQLSTERLLNFFVQGVDGLYKYLNNRKFEVEVQITKENGTDLDEDDLVGPVNELLNTMLKSMEMELKSAMVTDRKTMYAFRNTIENLMNFNK